MAIELHHLNTHGMMEQACDVLDGVVRLKERIAELESTIDKEKSWSETLSKNGVTMSHEIERLKAENERMKARIAELEKENAELKEQYRDMDVTHTVHIAKMNALIEELEESQRWRKFSEEKPENGQKVLFRAKYKTDNIRTWIGEFRNVGFDVFYESAPGWGCEFLPNEIFRWMPLPMPPEEEK